MDDKNIYNRIEKAIIPLDSPQIEEEDMKDTRIIITRNHLIYKNDEYNGSIQLTDIYNIDEKFNQKYKKAEDMFFFKFKDSQEEKKLGVIKTPYKNYLKKSILVSVISDVEVNYISSYQVEGRIYNDREWKRGVLLFTGDSIILVPEEEKYDIYEIPKKNMFKVQRDEVKGFDALKIHHEKANEEIVDIFYSTSISLSLLSEFCNEILVEEESQIDLDEKDRDILMAAHSGITDSKDLADYLGVRHEDVLDTLEELEKFSFMKEVERKVELTPKGKKRLDDML